MFFAQHHVCDAYFVPAINVFVGKMKKSSNKWLQRWGDEDRDGHNRTEKTVKGVGKPYNSLHVLSSKKAIFPNPTPRSPQLFV